MQMPSYMNLSLTMSLIFKWNSYTLLFCSDYIFQTAAQAALSQKMIMSGDVCVLQQWQIVKLVNVANV